MATVRHLGLFPWCLYPDKDSLKRELGLAEDLYQFNINFFEGFSAPVNVAVKMYWLVRKWKAEGSFDVAGPSNQVVTINYSYTYEREALNEKNLVCSAKQLIRQEELLTYSHPDYTALLSMSAAVFDIGIPQFPLALDRAGMPDPLEPNNLFVWQYVNFAGSEERGISGLIDTRVQLPVSPPYIISTYRLEAFEKVYEIPTFKITPLDSSLTVTAIEYWPYDPDDGGGPIYDKDTGAQRRPFPG